MTPPFIEDTNLEAPVELLPTGINYSHDYFINKFSSIPEEDWGIGEYVDRDGKCCAYGHCGVRIDSGPNEEAAALSKLGSYISFVNDNFTNVYGKYGATPKQRIVNYLKELRDGK